MVTLYYIKRALAWPIAVHIHTYIGFFALCFPVQSNAVAVIVLLLLYAHSKFPPVNGAKTKLVGDFNAVFGFGAVVPRMSQYVWTIVVKADKGADGPISAFNTPLHALLKTKAKFLSVTFWRYRAEPWGPRVTGDFSIATIG